MKNRILLWAGFFGLCYVIWVYRGWFSFSTHASGDFWYKFPESVRDFPLLPSLWNSNILGGLGGNASFLFGLESWYLGSAKILGLIGLGWEWIEKFIWFYPFLLVSFLGSFFLGKRIEESPFWAMISSVIYTTNSYILMIVGGGQMGVAMSIALAPWVLERALVLIDIGDRKNSILLALLIALQMLFDIRLSFVTGIAVFFLLVFRAQSVLLFLRRIVFFGISLAGAVGLLSFWFLPLAMTSKVAVHTVGLSALSLSSVRYFSFAPFEHAFSLLHPNWPENIFGKIQFLQPEFLLLPFLAYLGIFFIRKDTKNRYTYLGFVLTGLVGAFLAKGAKPPFSNIYEYAYLHIPGFGLFRDPSKFLLLVALSYTVLIPNTLRNVTEVFLATLRSRKKSIVTSVIALLFIVLWGSVHKESVLPGLGGTFRENGVTVEYTKLKDFLVKDSAFGRVLWVPTAHRLGFSSDSHPSVSAMNELGGTDFTKLSDTLRQTETIRTLKEWSVSYIVVPDDTYGEIFVTGRRYDDDKYQETVRRMDSMPGYSKVIQFGKIIVYQSQVPVLHVWFMNEDGNTTIAEFNKLSNTSYTVKKPVGTKTTALFLSERYDPGWVAKVGNKTIQSEKTDSNINVFQLSDETPDTISLLYEPQKFVWIGVFFSAVTMLFMIFSLFGLKT